jgi:uncharacterized protein (TIGR02284 family)
MAADVLQTLINLCQLDIDAYRAYEQALENITHANIATTIRGFQADHDRHVRELSDAIRRLGGTPPERKPDLKGFLLEGFTAIRSATGTAGALKAMESNEMLTNNRYEAALSINMPDDIRLLVQKNREDERRHLDWIRDANQRQIWNVGPERRPGA